jgi:predicted Rossmann-fold nucleotide-binding protein
MQTMKMPRMPVVMVDRGYWSKVINFEHLAREGMIERAYLELFSTADDAEGAWSELVRLGLRMGPREPGYPSK